MSLYGSDMRKFFVLNLEMVFRVRRGVLPRGPTVNADLVKSFIVRVSHQFFERDVRRETFHNVGHCLSDDCLVRRRRTCTT